MVTTFITNLQLLVKDIYEHVTTSTVRTTYLVKNQKFI